MAAVFRCALPETAGNSGVDTAGIFATLAVVVWIAIWWESQNGNQIATRCPRKRLRSEQQNSGIGVPPVVLWRMGFPLSSRLIHCHQKHKKTTKRSFLVSCAFVVAADSVSPVAFWRGSVSSAMSSAFISNGQPRGNHHERTTFQVSRVDPADLGIGMAAE
jgi:hypothetical protein